MAKLVAFYSRADENYFGGKYRFIETGNTEKVARLIAEQTGADLFRIEQKNPYSPNYNTCIAEARRDKQAHARPELTAWPDHFDQYDEIYLGYPNYWGDMPMAVYTFLEHFDWTGKVIHPFCTHEGSGLAGTEKKIQNTCKGARIKPGLAILGSRADDAAPAVSRWLGI